MSKYGSYQPIYFFKMQNYCTFQANLNVTKGMDASNFHTVKCNFKTTISHVYSSVVKLGRRRYQIRRCKNTGIVK